MKFGVKISAAVSVALGAYICFAQNQVQTQVPNQVNSRVAGTGVDNNVHRFTQENTTQMMASEMRNEYWQSGLLPGEVRGNFMMSGPANNAAGQAAYFNSPSGRTSGSSYNDSRTDMLARPSVPSASTYGGSGAGSVRFSNTVAPRSTATTGGGVGSVRFDSRVG